LHPVPPTHVTRPSASQVYLHKPAVVRLEALARELYHRRGPT